MHEGGQIVACYEGLALPRDSFCLSEGFRFTPDYSQILDTKFLVAHLPDGDALVLQSNTTSRAGGDIRLGWITFENRIITHLDFKASQESTPVATSTPRPTATPTRAQSSSDRDALVALYHSTGGTNWDANTIWLSDRPIGEWHGVTTDSNGRVTELALQDNNLAGTLPTELARLSSLTELALHRNHRLTGAISPELGNLSNLSLLSLYGNQFTGEIPLELGDLSNLTALYLTANQFTGEIPPELARLSNLMVLALNQNQLTGEIPSELRGLSKLTVLWLSANELTGCIPEGLRDIADNDLAPLNLPDCGAATPVPTPWLDNPPDETHSLAAEVIKGIVEQDSSYGTKVARLSWVIDGVDREEVRVLEILAETFNEDQELACYIVSPDFRPFLSNPGLESISRVAEYECLSDGLNANEMRALISIVGIAKHDHELAGSLLDFSWLSDGITDEESILLYSLSSLIPHRTDILERFLEIQGLADGVIRSERVALEALASLSRRDPELARQALNYEWVVDGVTWNEFLVLSELRETPEWTLSYIRDADSRPPELTTEFVWLTNDLDANEIRAFFGIAITRQLAPLIHDRLQDYSWVADGITRRESEILIDLYYTASNDVEFARQIVGIGLLDDPIRGQRRIRPEIPAASGRDSRWTNSPDQPALVRRWSGRRRIGLRGGSEGCDGPLLASDPVCSIYNYHTASGGGS